MTTAEMLTMSDIEDLANYALQEHGLTLWRFEWDEAVRRAGICRYGPRVIGLSRPIFAMPENRDGALDTILHEIAHALVGPGAGHGPEWRRMAACVGSSTDRCHTMPTPPSRLVGTCDCGPIHKRERMPRNNSTRICKTCRADVRYRLR
jgi:predicted SprT family Zn-dependent metalloprotease